MHHFSLHAVVSGIDTAAGLNLLDRSSLRPSRKKHIWPDIKLHLKSPSNQLIRIVGTIKLVALLGYLHDCVTFRVVHHFVIRISPGSSYIDQFISELFLPERRILPVHLYPSDILASNSYDKAIYFMITAFVDRDYNYVHSTSNQEAKQTENWSIAVQTS